MNTPNYFEDPTTDRLILDTSGFTFEEDEQWLRERYPVVDVEWDVEDVATGGTYTILTVAPGALLALPAEREAQRLLANLRTGLLLGLPLAY